MKFWFPSPINEEREDAAVEAFVRAINDVCRRHRMTFGADMHDGLTIYKNSSDEPFYAERTVVDLGDPRVMEAARKRFTGER